MRYLRSDRTILFISIRLPRDSAKTTPNTIDYACPNPHQKPLTSYNKPYPRIHRVTGPPQSVYLPCCPESCAQIIPVAAFIRVGLSGMSRIRTGAVYAAHWMSGRKETAGKTKGSRYNKIINSFICQGINAKAYLFLMSYNTTKWKCILSVIPSVGAHVCAVYQKLESTMS